MKTIKMAIGIALIFWGLQFVLFALLLAPLLMGIILNVCSFGGIPTGEYVWENIVRALLAMLTFPTLLFAQPDDLCSSLWAFFALITVNSLVWGVGIVALFHLFK